MKRLFNTIDEWKIIQDKIEFEENRLAESIMSIGNGYMGMRGNYDGSICLPSFAIVQYALTISNRLTSEAPNANEGSSSKGLLIPMSCAVLDIQFTHYYKKQIEQCIDTA